MVNKVSCVNTKSLRCFLDHLDAVDLRNSRLSVGADEIYLSCVCGKSFPVRGGGSIEPMNGDKFFSPLPPIDNPTTTTATNTTTGRRGSSTACSPGVGTHTVWGGIVLGRYEEVVVADSELLPVVYTNNNNLSTIFYFPK